MNKEAAIAKIFESLTSVKFFIIVLSTALFMIDKLNQEGWIMMVLSITGMRVASQFADAYKGVQVAKAGKAAKK